MKLEIVDHFAGLAMQALVSSWEGDYDSRTYSVLSHLAYEMAEAMVRERNKRAEQREDALGEGLGDDA